MPGHAVYGASKIAPAFLVEVLAKEIGHRGVTVNAVLPSATEGAGVSTDDIRPAAQESLIKFNPMGRAGSLDDVANAVEFLLSPGAGCQWPAAAAQWRCAGLRQATAMTESRLIVVLVSECQT